MKTIQLKVNEKIYEQFLSLLDRFSEDEVEIISEDKYFLETQRYLQQELNEMDSSEAKFYSQDEVETKLKNIMDKYADNL